MIFIWALELVQSVLWLTFLRTLFQCSGGGLLFWHGFIRALAVETGGGGFFMTPAGDPSNAPTLPPNAPHSEPIAGFRSRPSSCRRPPPRDPALKGSFVVRSVTGANATTEVWYGNALGRVHYGVAILANRKSGMYTLMLSGLFLYFHFLDFKNFRFPLNDFIAK